MKKGWYLFIYIIVAVIGFSLMIIMSNNQQKQILTSMKSLAMESHRLGWYQGYESHLSGDANKENYEDFYRSDSIEMVEIIKMSINPDE